MSVYQLIYTSRSTPAITDEVLLDILNKAEIYNCLHQLTGLLILYNYNFIQLLEGDEIEVKKLLAKIKNDHRHTDLKIILETKNSNRSMPTWAMGACLINHKNDELNKDQFYLSIQDTHQICESMSSDVGNYLLNFLNGNFIVI
jgi:hypothetical protein